MSAADWNAWTIAIMALESRPFIPDHRVRYETFDTGIALKIRTLRGFASALFGWLP